MHTHLLHIHILTYYTFTHSPTTHSHTHLLHIHTLTYYTFAHSPTSHSHTHLLHIHTLTYNTFTHSPTTLSHTHLLHIHTLTYYTFTHSPTTHSHPSPLIHSHTHLLHIHTLTYYTFTHSPTTHSHTHLLHIRTHIHSSFPIYSHIYILLTIHASQLFTSFPILISHHPLTLTEQIIFLHTRHPPTSRRLASPHPIFYLHTSISSLVSSPTWPPAPLQQEVTTIAEFFSTTCENNSTAQKNKFAWNRAIGSSLFCCVFRCSRDLAPRDIQFAKISHLNL